MQKAAAARREHAAVLARSPTQQTHRQYMQALPVKRVNSQTTGVLTPPARMSGFLAHVYTPIDTPEFEVHTEHIIDWLIITQHEAGRYLQRATAPQPWLDGQTREVRTGMGLTAAMQSQTATDARRGSSAVTVFNCL